MIITDQTILTQKCERIESYEEGVYVCNQLVKASKQFENIVGLSAPQIGIHKNAFIFIYSYGQFMYFINPVLKRAGKKINVDTERCFSVPNQEFVVKRYNKITVRDDINGKQIFRGFAARVWQHEYDHLQGKTLLQTGKIVKE